MAANKITSIQVVHSSNNSNNKKHKTVPTKTPKVVTVANQFQVTILEGRKPENFLSAIEKYWHRPETNDPLIQITHLLVWLCENYPGDVLSYQYLAKYIYNRAKTPAQNSLETDAVRRRAQSPRVREYLTQYGCYPEVHKGVGIKAVSKGDDVVRVAGKIGRRLVTTFDRFQQALQVVDVKTLTEPANREYFDNACNIVELLAPEAAALLPPYKK